MCPTADTPSTARAQQKAATTPKLMNTMAATSWKQRWERLGRGRDLPGAHPAQVLSPLRKPVAPPWSSPEPHGNSSCPVLTRNPHGTSLGPCRGTRPPPWVLARSPTGLSPRTLQQLRGGPHFPPWLLETHHAGRGAPTSARPTRPLACFMGAQGAEYTHETLISPTAQPSW